MNPTDSSPPAPPSTSPASRPFSLVRFIAAALLAALFTIVLGLAVAPLVLGPSRDGWLTLAVIALLFTGVITTARRLPRGSWWRLVPGYLVLAPVFVYLAKDDAILRHPTTLEEIAPAFPGAEKSFEVLMRYGKNHQLGRDFKAPSRIFGAKSGPFGDPAKPAEWRKWLVDHRADIEADWADLAPVHAWWKELNTFDRIADLTPARANAEIVAFGPFRSYSQHAIAIAGLQALDGHGDDALATLLPVLEVSRKLEPSARTLVRFMIARVIQKMAIESAAFVLDTTPVSPASRARLKAALSGGSGGEAGARRLIGIEYSFGLGAFGDLRMGDILVLMAGDSDHRGGFTHFLPPTLLNVMSPLAYNPRRTFNTLGDLTAQLQDFAAHRETSRMGPFSEEFFRDEGRARFKNLFGAVIAFEWVPAFTKVTETYWKIEDKRAALLARLAAP